MRNRVLKSKGQTPVPKMAISHRSADFFDWQDVLATTKFIDIHTHLFAPAFGKARVWASTKY